RGLRDITKRKRGIRQGCPISPFLFLLPMQILAHFIKNSIQIAEREICLSQLADDTTLFLKDCSQINIAIKLVNEFSSASGLKLNLSKCELLPIKTCYETEISGIPVKRKVKYLGISITKEENQRSVENFNPLVALIQKKCNMWLQRDLSISGRVLLSKAEGLSSLVYASSALEVSNEINRRAGKKSGGLGTVCKKRGRGEIWTQNDTPHICKDSSRRQKGRCTTR
uniref:Reverse transcriptase domain-containing protein n=1 Tax=Poecilia latipinna TaxID=48699 RepID=A0A3B3TJU2_9TELE